MQTMVALTAEIISFWGIRNPLSTLTHLSGAVLAAVGFILLLRRAGARDLPRRSRTALSVYACSVIGAFIASTLFHYFPWTGEELIFLKKMDHAAIFLVIAATATVILDAVFHNPWRQYLITITWITAVGAMAVKMAIWPMSLWNSAFLYIFVGGVGTASVLPMLRSADWRRLKLVAYGLAVFTVGAVVFATERPVLWEGYVEGHELFHIMVLLGAGLHFIFVFRYCTAPGALAPMPEQS